MHALAHVLWGLAVVAGFAAAVMLLWNALVPAIFGLTSINFWQALGLLVLCHILFGSFGSVKHGMGVHFRHNPVREKWQKMTPEEREEFIRRRRHFGHGFLFGHDGEGKQG
jgi:hypothetical protein